MHQLLHTFHWDGQNQDIPYDQLQEENHNICLIFPKLAKYLSICQSDGYGLIAARITL